MVVRPVLVVDNRAPHSHLDIAVERESNLRFRQAKVFNIAVKVFVTLSGDDSIGCLHDKLELLFLNASLYITLRLTVLVNGDYRKNLFENHLTSAASDVERDTCTDVEASF